jgi:selenocysteine lyase/cysteine desulfurase
LAFTEHDRVVVFRGEFPANVTPWRQAVRRAGGELVTLAQEGRTDAEVLEDLEQTLKQGRVRLVAASAVQFATGRVMPIGPMARLAHAYGAELCVDAIQALGILPFDLQALDVDYVCSGAHKWLMGLEGVGFVYVAPRHQQALRPLTAGWLSHEQPLRFLLEGPGFLDVEPTIRSAPGFLEGHSLNAVGCMALEAGVGLLQQLGVAAIHAHVGRLNDVLETGLVARGFRSLRSPGGGAGTLSVAPPDDLTAIAIAAGLDAEGVSVSAPDGKLRFSPHWPNSEGELEPVLDRLDAVCTALR